MSASDYMVGNAPSPASFKAPDMAQLLATMLGNLPKDATDAQQAAFTQQQNQRTAQLQGLFKDGLPTGQDGHPDVNAMVDRISKAGGADMAKSMIPFLLQQKQIASENTDADPAEAAPPQPRTGPSSSVAAGSPDSIRGPQPRLSSAGMDNEGGDTVRSIAAEMGGQGRDLAKRIPNYARALKVDPDSPLTPSQVESAKSLIRRNLGAEGGGQGGEDQGPSGLSAGAGSEGAPRAAGDRNQNNATPAAGSPQQAQGPRAAAAGASMPAPAPPIVTTPWRAPGVGGGPAGASPAAALVPDGYKGDPLKYAEALDKRAERLFKQSAGRETVGMGGAKAKEAEAKTLNERATAIRAALGKAADETNPAKLDFAARQEEQKGEIAAGQKEYDGIVKLGTEARLANQKIDLARRFADDPNFMSGPAEGINRRIKQWVATIGGNPNSAQPQEAFKKAVGDLLSEQIRAMAGSGVGRVLMTEVQTMKDSIASLGITPATNRLLLEELSRVHNVQATTQDLAAQYVKQHGHLDAQWPGVVAQYYKANPMFSPAELNDPRLIAPPQPPPHLNGVQIETWAKRMGLKPGDPIRIGSDPKTGKPIIKAVPPFGGETQ